MSKLTDYPFEVRPLSVDAGGGFLVSFPDFAECISDGETVDEAITNGRDALKAAIAALTAKEDASTFAKQQRRGLRQVRCPRAEDGTRSVGDARAPRVFR